MTALFRSRVCKYNPWIPDPETEKRPVPRPGTPSRHTRSFARCQQKTGRGEGLIYNIPSAYFQTTRQNEESSSPRMAAREKASSLRGKPLVTCLTILHGESRLMH